MERTNTTNRILIGVGFALLIGAGGFYWYSSRQKAAEPVVETPVVEVPAAEDSGIKYPLPPAPPVGEAAPEVPLPLLADSDAPLTGDLGALFGEPSIAAYLMPEAVVRRFVVTVDNLARNKGADRLRPIKGVEGLFTVNRKPTKEAGAEDQIRLASENYLRYEQMVKLLAATDMKKVAALYMRYYPLFQESYEDLGNPEQYFNDRLVSVIDHLLQTPNVPQPIALTQPNVFYEFADASLESRSWGQKILIRMGAKNAAVVKTKLRELRAAVIPAVPKKPVAVARPQAAVPVAAP